MSLASLTFTVTAVPKPQGSKRGFVVKGKDGGKPRAIIVDADKEPLRSFRDAVRAEALAAAGDGWQALTGPLTVSLAFALPKPKVAERGPRRWPIGKNAGDVDKLTRSVLDALTDAGIWGDDGQVVDLHVTKDYPETAGGGYLHAPGVRVLISQSIRTERLHNLFIDDAMNGQPELPLTQGVPAS